MKNEIAERTAAQEIVYEGARVAKRCIWGLNIAGLGTVASGICNALMAYTADVEKLAPNPEGRMLARQVVREETRLIIKCLTGLASGKVGKLCDAFTGELREYLAEEE